jgi:hypothetical protein
MMAASQLQLPRLGLVVAVVVVVLAPLVGPV